MAEAIKHCHWCPLFSAAAGFGVAIAAYNSAKTPPNFTLKLETQNTHQTPVQQLTYFGVVAS